MLSRNTTGLLDKESTMFITFTRNTVSLEVNKLYLKLMWLFSGPVVRVTPDEVDICDVGAAREIHKIGAKYYKAPFYRTLGPPVAQNLFTATDPKFHSGRRRVLAPFFAESSISKMEPVISERINLAIGRIGTELSSRGSADVFKWWTLMAIDIMGELSFGQSFNMLERGEVYQLDYRKRRTDSKAW